MGKFCCMTSHELSQSYNILLRPIFISKTSIIIFFSFKFFELKNDTRILNWWWPDELINGQDREENRIGCMPCTEQTWLHRSLVFVAFVLYFSFLSLRPFINSHTRFEKLNVNCVCRTVDTVEPYLFRESSSLICLMRGMPFSGSWFLARAAVLWTACVRLREIGGVLKNSLQPWKFR